MISARRQNGWEGKRRPNQRLNKDRFDHDRTSEKGGEKEKRVSRDGGKPLGKSSASHQRKLDQQQEKEYHHSKGGEMGGEQRLTRTWSRR